jgi:hypothetical protein
VVAGSFLATGSTYVSNGGVVHFTGAVLGVGNPLDVSGETGADFSPATPTSLTVSTLIMDNYLSVLSGTANFTVTGLLDWQGSVSGSGTLTSLGLMHLHGGAASPPAGPRASGAGCSTTRGRSSMPPPAP